MKTKKAIKPVQVALDAKDRNLRIVQMLRQVVNVLSDDCPNMKWKTLVEICPDYTDMYARDKEAVKWFHDLPRDEQTQLLKMV